MIHVGDCRESMRAMPAESVQCCVTSPPYFGLRDYGVEGQIGLEATPELFIASMVEVFRELRRVLRDDGTLWLNIGDSYAGSGRGGNTNGTSGLEGSTESQEKARTAKEVSAAQREHCVAQRGSRLYAGLHGAQVEARALGRAWVPPPAGLKNKDLIGIPWMLAFALRADGWYLRQDIIWAKPNPMPESVRDRCTKSHEYLFLLSKSQRYFYDVEAIKEQAVYGNEAMYAGDESGLHSGQSHAGSGTSTRRFAKGVAGWATGPGDHSTTGHATGDRTGTHAAAVKKAKGNRKTFRGGGLYTDHKSFNNSAEPCNDSVGNAPAESIMRNKRSVWTVATQPFKEAHFATFPEALIEPCILAGSRAGDTVIDPFMGAGTTAVVCERLGRRWVGCELNPDYAGMANARIRATQPGLQFEAIA